MFPGLGLYSLYSDPAQYLIAANTGSTVDDLDHDLDRDLFEIDDLDRDLSDVDDLYHDLSDVDNIDHDLCQHSSLR